MRSEMSVLAMALNCGERVSCAVDDPLPRGAQVDIRPGPKAVPAGSLAAMRGGAVRGMVIDMDGADRAMVLVVERRWNL